jgi:hypothetical protein
MRVARIGTQGHRSTAGQDDGEPARMSKLSRSRPLGPSPTKRPRFFQLLSLSTTLPFGGLSPLCAARLGGPLPNRLIPSESAARKSQAWSPLKWGARHRARHSSGSDFGDGRHARRNRRSRAEQYREKHRRESRESLLRPDRFAPHCGDALITASPDASARRLGAGSVPGLGVAMRGWVLYEGHSSGRGRHRSGANTTFLGWFAGSCPYHPPLVAAAGLFGGGRSSPFCSSTR